MHSDAPTAADTDWDQIVALYDQLLAPVTRRRSSPSTGPSPWPSATARPPRSPRSTTSPARSTATTCSTPPAPTSSNGSAGTTRPSAAYDRALALTTNAAERDLLRRRRDARRALAGGAGDLGVVAPLEAVEHQVEGELELELVVAARSDDGCRRRG